MYALSMCRPRLRNFRRSFKNAVGQSVVFTKVECFVSSRAFVKTIAFPHFMYSCPSLIDRGLLKNSYFKSRFITKNGFALSLSIL